MKKGAYINDLYYIPDEIIRKFKFVNENAPIIDDIKKILDPLGIRIFYIPRGYRFRNERKEILQGIISHVFDWNYSYVSKKKRKWKNLFKSEYILVDLVNLDVFLIENIEELQEIYNIRFISWLIKNKCKKGFRGYNSWCINPANIWEITGLHINLDARNYYIPLKKGVKIVINGVENKEN